MKYKIGQRVVCNNRILEPGYQPNVLAARALGFTLPVPRKVYTIRGVSTIYGGIGYVLEEIVNRPVKFTMSDLTEIHFDEPLFSPVHDTSIEVEKLKRLQNPANHDLMIYIDPPMIERVEEKAA